MSFILPLCVGVSIVVFVAGKVDLRPDAICILFESSILVKAQGILLIKITKLSVVQGRPVLLMAL
jgi:hypothetical protein